MDSDPDLFNFEEAWKSANDNLRFATTEVAAVKGHPNILPNAQAELEKAKLLLLALNKLRHTPDSHRFLLVLEAFKAMQVADGNGCCWWSQSGGSSYDELGTVQAIWTRCQQDLAKLDSVGK